MVARQRLRCATPAPASVSDACAPPARPRFRCLRIPPSLSVTVPIARKKPRSPISVRFKKKLARNRASRYPETVFKAKVVKNGASRCDFDGSAAEKGVFWPELFAGGQKTGNAACGVRASAAYRRLPPPCAPAASVRAAAIGALPQSPLRAPTAPRARSRSCWESRTCRPARRAAPRRAGARRSSARGSRRSCASAAR